MLPFSAPTWLGINVTVMVQLAPTATATPQSLVCAKSPAATMLAMFSGAVPTLVRVTGKGLLVVPTGWSGNTRLVDDNKTPGSTPFPLTLTF